MKSDSTITRRKGARRLAEVPPHIILSLNKGEIETANLIEGLALNQKILLTNILSEFGLENYTDQAIASLINLKNPTITNVMNSIGNSLFMQSKADNTYQSLLNKLKKHRSDTVRSWAALLIGLNNELSIENKLNEISVFAADPHFGVREYAWLSVRPSVAENLDESIKILSKWSLDSDPNIRRFASEVTRPRGVWCKHIDILKETPAIGLPILEPLKADNSRYVQLSVGNWLNDASKTNPLWVYQLCEKWENESPSMDTFKIITKAKRTINKM